MGVQFPAHGFYKLGKIRRGQEFPQCKEMPVIFLIEFAGQPVDLPEQFLHGFFVQFLRLECVKEFRFNFYEVVRGILIIFLVVMEGLFEPGTLLTEVLIIQALFFALPDHGGRCARSNRFYFAGENKPFGHKPADKGQVKDKRGKEHEF